MDKGMILREKVGPRHWILDPLHDFGTPNAGVLHSPRVGPLEIALLRSDGTVDTSHIRLYRIITNKCWLNRFDVQTEWRLKRGDVHRVESTMAKLTSKPLCHSENIPWLYLLKVLFPFLFFQYLFITLDLMVSLIGPKWSTSNKYGVNGPIRNTIKLKVKIDE